jgi:hypothetical protein
MMLVLGGLHAVYGVSELLDNAWELEKANGLAAGDLWAWGIVDMLSALFLLVAGASLLGGGSFGRVVGLVWASLSAVRWLYWIPAEPLFAVVMVVVDVSIILSLTGNPQFFGTRARR